VCSRAILANELARVYWRVSTITDSNFLLHFRARARGAQFPTGQELDDHSKSQRQSLKRSG
jgi:hypothetical protein